ncbi:MAG: hypothetical protein CVV03_09295 [Firmicutes bacterium HGW-Firmicutes-8]|nr:MAG: hypothetical protein CVV03_09295 [Firmicutes bacterium HGW-Firmicutes-8]
MRRGPLNAEPRHFLFDPASTKVKDAFMVKAANRGGCLPVGFLCNPLLRQLAKIPAMPQGGAMDGGAAQRHGCRLGG